MLRLYALLFIIGILGSTIYGAYWYYTDTQNRIATLRESNAKLLVTNEINEKTIAQQKIQAEQNQKRLGELQASLQEAERYGDELRSTLNKHNLTALAIRKPGLIQNRINNASDKLLEDIVGETTPSSPNPNTP